MATDDTGNEIPTDLDMEAVKQQVKVLKPEMLDQITACINNEQTSRAEQQRGPKYSSMTDGEFSAELRKLNIR